MKKKILSLLLISVCIVSCLSGCAFERKDSVPPSTELSEVAKTTTLESGNFYVWSDATFKKSDITNYTFYRDEEDGTVNPERIIWYSQNDEDGIPTVYAGDEIVYCCGEIMPEEFRWERFEDLGYTIGITWLTELPSGKYALDLDATDGHIYDKSDIGEAMSEYADIGEVIVDKVGGVSLTDSCVDESGTIVGLKKSASYDVEYYVGTYMKETTAAATYHAFSSMEEVYSVDYDFLQSDIATIKIPEGLKTGYYLLGGTMFFRYVDGDSYDGSTDFNVSNLDEEGNMEGITESTEDTEVTKPVETFKPEQTETESVTEGTESTETADTIYTDYSEKIHAWETGEVNSVSIIFRFADGTDWENEPVKDAIIKDGEGNEILKFDNDSDLWKWDPESATLTVSVNQENTADPSNLQFDLSATDAYQDFSISVE